MEDVLEFEGEYIGGQAGYTDRRQIKMRLAKENLVVAPSAFSSSYLGQPLFSIPYVSISSVQDMPSERISTLRVLISPIGGLLWRKNEHYLAVTFKDDLDMEHTTIFKMKKPEEAQAAVYDKVVTAKFQKKRLGK